MNKYLRHIKQLCRKYAIILYTGKDYREFMSSRLVKTNKALIKQTTTPTFSYPLTRSIFIPKIHTVKYYFAALHEIGHVLTSDPNEHSWRRSAVNLGKVTKKMLRSEQKASIIAMKLFKYGTHSYMDKRAFWNQYAYVEQYERDWKTTLKDKNTYFNFTPLLFPNV